MVSAMCEYLVIDDLFADCRLVHLGCYLTGRRSL
jgi:hypothetical protein